MSGRVTVVSDLHGRTTDVPGRFTLRGFGFELVSDGSVRSGGPGEAAGSMDLLVASLVSCALNAFRRDLLEHGEPERQVEIFARVERRSEGDYLGTLVMECFIDGADGETADRLVREFRKRCRIYNALKDSLPVVLIAHTPDSLP